MIIISFFCCFMYMNINDSCLYINLINPQYLQVQTMQIEYYEDMCEMGTLNQQSILNNLIQRYNKDQIFTYIGPTLLAVNPYRKIPQLFNQQLTAEMTENIMKGNLGGPPHIYLIAGKAFHNMKNNKQLKQSIIISGESGAGKTESTKYCMQILTKLSNKKSHSIQKKILACNPLLEAFGNSKTVRNENSSRFGKYVQIMFGKDNTIKGAKIQNYLLQKSRVTMVAKNQRNFHVFYALTSSNMYGVKSPEHYAYLSSSNCYTANNINDNEFYLQIRQSFIDIGFAQGEQQKIWKLLLVILQLGNIQFDDTRHQQNQANPCIIIDKTSLTFISQTLQLSEQKLQQILLYKTKKILKEVHQIAIKKIDCQTNRNTLSKAIYNSIFQFIIDKIQIALSPNNQEDSYELMDLSQTLTSYCQISILDIFGFQNFEKNSIEQICINFTNERLLAQYNQRVFESEINILKQDGLQDQISDIVPPSNMSIITRLTQIFDIINEQTPRPQFTESNMMATMRIKYQRSNEVTFERTNQNIFKINHSPCIVSYSIQQFKIKNQDELTPQINDICINILPNTDTVPQEANKKSKTILIKFTDRIGELIKTLSQGTNHFVRCIKPNQEKRSDFINPAYTKTQIKYLGVFQTIKIRKAIFPVRKIYEQFTRLYQDIFIESKGKTHKQAAKIILRKINAPQRSYRFGNNRVYLNNDINDQLQKKLQIYMKIRTEKATFIQKRYRIYHCRKLLQHTLNVIIKEIKLRKRIQKFENISSKILLRKRQNFLFMGLHYIKEESSQRYQKMMQQHEPTEQNLEKGYTTNDTQVQRNQYSKPYQFHHPSSVIIERYENELMERTEQLEKSIIIKQEHFENEKFRLQKQKDQQFQVMSSCIAELQKRIKQKDDQSKALNQKLNHFEAQIQDKNQIINKLTIMNQQLHSQKQQLLEEKHVLIDEINLKDKRVDQLKNQVSQININFQKVIAQAQSSHDQIEQNERNNEQLFSRQRDDLYRKIKFLQDNVKSYEIIVAKYKLQKDIFIKQKQQLHKKVLEKMAAIDVLKRESQNHTKVNEEMNKKDLQIKSLKQKNIHLQDEVIEFLRRQNRKSQELYELELKIYTQQTNLHKDYTNADLVIKDMKIEQLKQSLAHEKQKVATLQQTEKNLTKKLNNHLKEVADFNNKINMANQRFNRDHLKIKEYQAKIVKLQQALKSKDQKYKSIEHQNQLSRQQIIYFLRVYQQDLPEAQRTKLKNEIMKAIDNK